MQQRIDNIDNMQQRIDNMQQRIGNMQQHIDNMQQNIDNMQQRVTDTVRRLHYIYTIPNGDDGSIGLCRADDRVPAKLHAVPHVVMRRILLACRMSYGGRRILRLRMRARRRLASFGGMG
jgi:hypothetical protein